MGLCLMVGVGVYLYKRDGCGRVRDIVEEGEDKAFVAVFEVVVVKDS